MEHNSKDQPRFAIGEIHMDGQELKRSQAEL